MYKHTFINLFVLLILSGCGGGGSGSAAPSTSAEGLWMGTTGDGREIAGLVLDSGEYWVLYSLVGNNAVIAGAVQGNGTSQNGSFTSSNGKDFNLEGDGISNTTTNANYVMKQSFNGTISYPATGVQNSFTTSYDAAYELVPDLNTISGTYTGSAATNGGTVFATVTVTGTGVLTGSSAGGCTYNGTVTPRANGNVYNVTVTFNGGACSNGTNTVTGVAYYTAASKQLNSAALDSSRSNGFIFVGTKP